MSDPALLLRIAYDNGQRFEEAEMLRILHSSPLVRKLTSELIDNPFYYVWRIIALSEIPYAAHLEYTQKLKDKIYHTLAIDSGFSLSGNKKMFLPCYNAMLVSALSRLGYAGDEPVRNAVSWINTFQPMERNRKVDIPGFRFDRYGGCFHNTPCYINIAKSTMALLEYQRATGDRSFREKTDQGTEYILNHHLFRRLSNGQPITPNILSISFPESYHLNIVELLRLVALAGKTDDIRVNDAYEYLQGVKNGNGWKINYRYKAQGYIVFDKGRGNGEWVTYIINNSANPLNTHDM